MNNQDRYTALIQEGRLTPAEAKELAKAFPDPKPQEEHVIKVLDWAEYDKMENELLMSGYRHRTVSAPVEVFSRKADYSVKLASYDFDTLRLFRRFKPPQTND
ncbi:hypothetical protein N5C81_13345 [Rhizobium pusense]|uniref:hypothetical protein n=1 Tax=Agrobacterium pusense TaxID=648995 RepID=UPI00244C0164|nr:hypothetical protein [Agrobacterium pusense]MDH1268606.1 hypothetical protein [Agrobacterium pusense]